MKVHIAVLNIAMAVLVTWLSVSGTVHGIYRYHGEPSPAWVDYGQFLFPITGGILGLSLLHLVARWAPLLLGVEQRSHRAGAPSARQLTFQHDPQFIQINYSLGEREADERILPLAQDMGIAVLINRPYQAGRLFRTVAGRDLPDWAADFAASWGQFLLKFIISHPAVTCVIPATSKLRHMTDNLGAGFGELPDAKTRQRMVEFIESI